MAQKEFSFDSEDFAGMRYVITMEMDKVVRLMKEKNLKSGSLSFKMKIGMMEVTNDDGTIRQVFIFDPDISSRIGDKYKAKCHAVGGEITVGEDGELRVGRAEQVTIDELMEAQKEEEKKGA